MFKLQKALQKLTPKERETIKVILRKILARDFAGLDMKKLKGTANIYRIKKGSLRIIYQVNKEVINIIAIERRNEKTYRDF